MPLLAPPPQAVVTRGSKRRFVVICAAIVVVLGAVGIWAVVRPGSYERSNAGCVTVTIPSTTGGGLVHECGKRAQVLCRDAFRHQDRLSMLIRPECRKAGLG